MLQIVVGTEALTSQLFLVHVATLVAAVGLFRFAVRHRDAVPSRWFAAWLGVTCAWIAVHTLGLAIVHPGLRHVLDSLELALVAGAATCWLLYALAFGGRWGGGPTPLAKGLATVTGTLVLVLVTNPLHSVAFGSGPLAVEYGVAVGAAGGEGATTTVLVVLVYVFGAYLAGIGVLLDLAFSTDRFYRDQIAGVVAAVAIPLAVATAVMFSGTVSGIDLTPLSFGLSSLILTYVAFRSEVLEAVPAKYRVGERTALESLEQGVLVRDRNGHVVFTNDSAETLLDADAEALLGRELDEVLARSPLEAVVRWIDDGSTAQRTDGSGSAATAPTGGVPDTLRNTRTGRIYRAFESSDESDRPVTARTLFLKDVTEERRRKQRLLVLNRIVRHNLRNDMNVLTGYVDVLADEVDDESVDVVEDIATDLLHLGEKAHEMDRVIRQARSADQRVNVATVVDRVAGAFEAESNARVEVWGDVQAWTRTDVELLETIVGNLLEVAAVRQPDVASTADSVRTDGRYLADDPVGSGVGGAGVAIEEATGTGPESASGASDASASGQSARDADASPSADASADTGTAANGGAVANDGAAANAGVPTSGDARPEDVAANVPPVPTVIVTVTADEDAVRISVENDGPGIPAEEIRSLLDGEVSALRHGASIGLWVVKWCVELADATWEIETGEWTRVTVTFPSEPDLQTTATGLGDAD